MWQDVAMVGMSQGNGKGASWPWMPVGVLGYRVQETSLQGLLGGKETIIGWAVVIGAGLVGKRAHPTPLWGVGQLGQPCLAPRH